MDLLFFIPNSILPASIFCLILSYIFLFIFIEQSFLKERVREELTHNKAKNGVVTSGGFIFIGAFLISLNILKENFITSASIVFIMIIIIMFKKKILSYYFLPLMSVLFALINIKSIYLIKNDNIIVLTTTVFLIFLLGLCDDYHKIIKKVGLSEKILFVCQSLIGLLPVLYNYINHHSYIRLFSYKLELGILYIPIGLFIFNGTVNSANLTDGVNGGLTIPTIIIAVFFILFHIKCIFFRCNYLIPIYDDICITSSILIIASLIPFLIFNLKNKIFMGNVGSMCIGAIIVSLSFFSKSEILLPIYGCLLVIETLSVIIQRFVFRRYKKRVFLFSPIHHHFELLGWANNKILLLMGGITLVGCLISLIII